MAGRLFAKLVRKRFQIHTGSSTSWMGVQLAFGPSGVRSCSLVTGCTGVATSAPLEISGGQRAQGLSKPKDILEQPRASR